MSFEILVNKRFSLGEKVGAGSFGEIYSGWLSMQSQIEDIKSDCGFLRHWQDKWSESRLETRTIQITTPPAWMGIQGVPRFARRRWLITCSALLPIIKWIVSAEGISNVYWFGREEDYRILGIDWISHVFLFATPNCFSYGSATLLVRRILHYKFATTEFEGYHWNRIADY